MKYNQIYINSINAVGRHASVYYTLLIIQGAHPNATKNKDRNISDIRIKQPYIFQLCM